MGRASVGQDVLSHILPVTVLGKNHREATSLRKLLGILVSDILGHLKLCHRADPAAKGRAGSRSAEERCEPVRGDDFANAGNCQATDAEEPARDSADGHALFRPARRLHRFGFGRNLVGCAGPLGDQRDLLDTESGVVKRVDRLLGQTRVGEPTDSRIIVSSAGLMENLVVLASIACFGRGYPPRNRSM